MKKRRTGFYLAGEFRKGKKAGFMVLPQTIKPFEIDSVEGTITGKGISIFDKKRRYMFPKKWYFFEGHKITDLNTNDDLVDNVNFIWEQQCYEFNRKYYPLFKKSGEENGKSKKNKK